MSKLFTAPKATSAVFLAAMAISVFASGGAKAGTAGNLHQCDSNNPSYTVQCCESLINNPEGSFIRNSGKSCRALVSCRGIFGNYRCYVRRDPPRGNIRKAVPVKFKPVIIDDQGGSNKGGNGGFGGNPTRGKLG